MNKKCTKCLVEKPLTDFHTRGINRHGEVAYHSQCKTCRKEWCKENSYKYKKPKTPYVIPESKICRYCEVEKPMSEFHFSALSKDRRQHKCKLCNIANSKKDYKENRKEITKKRARKRQLEFKDLCDSFKINGCSYCDEKSFCCLEFHHFDPSEKEHAISSLYARKNGDKIYNELTKCIVVCCNCHKKIHSGIIQAREEDKIKIVGLP